MNFTEGCGQFSFLNEELYFLLCHSSAEQILTNLL